MKKIIFCTVLLLTTVLGFSNAIRIESIEKIPVVDDEIWNQQAFVSTWDTSNTGVSATNQIMIPHGTHLVDYLVDWGDGTGIEKVTGVTAVTHTYASSGTYTVRMRGELGIRFSNGLEELSDAPKLLTIEQWGGVKWLSLESAFHGCENLDVLAADVPNLTAVNNLSNMFADCKSLVGSESFNQWNLSNIARTDRMFYGAERFNQDIGAWNVSNLESTAGMFRNASSFNQNIGSWKLERIKSLGFMFHSATAFNQDLSNWDISKVYDLDYMFYNATSFDQDLGTWNISNLGAAEEMFTNTKLSQDNYDALLNGWGTVGEGEGEVPRRISFSGGNSTYCAGKSGREVLNRLNWSISDGGPLGNCEEMDLDNVLDFSIYPNPSVVSVIASFSTPVTLEVIQVFDIQGRLIRTYDANKVKEGNGYRLEVNDMPAGTYFIRTQDTEGLDYQKQLLIRR